MVLNLELELFQKREGLVFHWSSYDKDSEQTDIDYCIMNDKEDCRDLKTFWKTC